jgi:hypothetical protein
LALAGQVRPQRVKWVQAKVLLQLALQAEAMARVAKGQRQAHWVLALGLQWPRAAAQAAAPQLCSHEPVLAPAGARSASVAQ